MKNLREIITLILLFACFTAGWWSRGRTQHAKVKVERVYYEKPAARKVASKEIGVNVPCWLFAPTSTATILHQNVSSSEERSDSLRMQVSIETHEYGGVDSAFRAVVSGPTIGGYGPKLDAFEFNRQTTVYQNYRWEIGPAAGAWCTPNGKGIWIGASARKNFGRFYLSGTLGYDTRNSGPFAQIQGGISIWRR